MSLCSFSCDYGIVGFYQERNVTRARKPHSCIECGYKIQPGEPYRYACGHYDGDFWSASCCKACANLLDWVQAHVPCFCVMWGVATEDAMECAREAAREAPGVYFGALRRLWRREVRRWPAIRC